MESITIGNIKFVRDGKTLVKFTGDKYFVVYFDRLKDAIKSFKDNVKLYKAIIK